MAETVADNAALAALWDAEKNGKTASEELARSYRTAWWTCASGHSFQRKPRMMADNPACPSCALGGASLADTHPGLAKHWPLLRATTNPKLIDSARQLLGQSRTKTRSLGSRV